MKSLKLAESPAETTLRQRLRIETDAIHQSLHRNPGLRRLISNQCSIQIYEDVLEVFARFYRELDGLFDTGLYQRFSYEAQPLLWLEHDFAALGKALPPPLITSQGKELIASGQPEAYIGYLYVKQGSTLGGQAISRQLHKTLGLEPGHSQFFFYGFGTQTGNHWNSFLDYLAQAEPTLDADVVVVHAKKYFQLLDAAFKQRFPEEA